MNGHPENSDFLASGDAWSVATGDGRTRPERLADKSALVHLHLSHALGDDATWQACVERVRGGEDALEVARIYGNDSKRRRVIATLLTRECVGLGSVVAYTVPEVVEEGHAGGNRYSRAFWAKTLRGCECIVRLGAGLCLGCGKPLKWRRLESSGVGNRTHRVEYCSDCPETAWDRDAIHDVFNHLASTLALEL